MEHIYSYCSPRVLLSSAVVERLKAANVMLINLMLRSPTYMRGCAKQVYAPKHNSAHVSGTTANQPHDAKLYVIFSLIDVAV